MATFSREEMERVIRLNGGTMTGDFFTGLCGGFSGELFEVNGRWNFRCNNGVGGDVFALLQFCIARWEAGQRA